MKNEWQRYNCQMALPGFDRSSQEKLSRSKVLVVGAGGLGCPCAQYLASCGVGRLTILDFDTVSESNLHRQILFNDSDIGKPKAIVAAEKLSVLNQGIEVVSLNERITRENVLELIDSYDVVVDCTDNIETKYLLNDACVINEIPLVYGAVYRYEGQVGTWNIRNDDGSFSPNYRDVFPEINSDAIPSCTDDGVFPPVAGIIGLMQASEVIRLITGCAETLKGKLLYFDGSTSRSRIISLGEKTRVSIDTLAMTNKVIHVTAGILNKWMEKGEAYLVDVREQKEFAAFNIGGSNVPLSSLADWNLETEKRVVLFCQSGRRSETAARLLSEKFPDHEFYSLKGGLFQWTSTARTENRSGDPSTSSGTVETRSRNGVV